MAESSKPIYHAYISCSEAEQDWVTDWLSSRLTKAGLKVLYSFDLRGGKSRVENISQAIAQSYRTIVIMTPAWLADNWKEFEGAIAILGDLAARKGQVIPLLLKECEIPTHLAFRQARDFRREKNWEPQCKQLIADVRDAVEVPFPIQVGATTQWDAWREWLRRYRWRVAWGLIGVVAALGAVSAITRFPQFEGWQRTELNVARPWRLARFDQTLLVATGTITGCNATDTGLWRSVDNGAGWSPEPMPLLKISSSGCELAAIYRFAVAPNAPRAIYAPTTNVGLLKGELSGTNWTKVKSDILPQDLYSAAVLGGETETIFVSGYSEGVFRLSTKDSQWTRLDGTSTCEDTSERKSLPAAAARKAQLVSNHGLIYVASPSVTANPPAILPKSGIYVSADDGNCWTQIHDADKKWMYTTLATSPELPEYVFFGATEREPLSPINPPHQIVSKIDRHTKGVTTLWDEKSILYGIHLNLFLEPKGRFWYLSTALGQAIRGQTDKNRTDLVGNSLGLFACRFQRACFSDLAQDSQSDIPLLLADQSVYRWSSTRSWFQALFP